MTSKIFTKEEFNKLVLDILKIKPELIKELDDAGFPRIPAMYRNLLEKLKKTENVFDTKEFIGEVYDKIIQKVAKYFSQISLKYGIQFAEMIIENLDEKAEVRPAFIEPYKKIIDLKYMWFEDNHIKSSFPWIKKMYTEIVYDLVTLEKITTLYNTSEVPSAKGIFYEIYVKKLLISKKGIPVEIKQIESNKEIKFLITDVIHISKLEAGLSDPHYQSIRKNKWTLAIPQSAYGKLVDLYLFERLDDNESSGNNLNNNKKIDKINVFCFQVTISDTMKVLEERERENVRSFFKDIVGLFHSKQIEIQEFFYYYVVPPLLSKI